MSSRKRQKIVRTVHISDDQYVKELQVSLTFVQTENAVLKQALLTNTERLRQLELKIIHMSAQIGHYYADNLKKNNEITALRVRLARGSP